MTTINIRNCADGKVTEPGLRKSAQSTQQWEA